MSVIPVAGRRRPDAHVALAPDATARIRGVRVLAALAIAVWTPLVHPATHSLEQTGKTIYGRVGCIACHEVDGKGSSFAPMLPGHTVEQVKRYVRKPAGKMPRFGSDKLSDAELDALAAYIAGLPVPETTLALDGPRDALEMHHWMAYRSLRDADPEHAEHHLLHAFELIEDDGHRRSLENILGLARAKRSKEAAQRILEMVSTKVTPEITIRQMHLRLALGALEAGDVPEVDHHVRHYIESALPHDKRHARQLLPLLQKGDMVSVRKRLTHLMAK